MKAFLIHEKQYQNKMHVPKIIATNDQIEIDLLLREIRCKIFPKRKVCYISQFKQWTQASRIWPLNFSHNIGINTNNHLLPHKSYTILSHQGVDTQPHSECLTYLGKQWQITTIRSSNNPHTWVYKLYYWQSRVQTHYDLMHYKTRGTANWCTKQNKNA